MAINIMLFPHQLGSLIGVSDFIAGLILGLFFTLLVLLPTIYLTKGKSGMLYTILAMSLLSLFTGIGWFPIYTIVLIILLIALGFGSKIAAYLGGS